MTIANYLVTRVKKQLGLEGFFQRVRKEIGLSKVAVKMQAEKANRHIESYKSTKKRDLKEVLHEFPSVDTYYQRIFLEQASHLKTKIKEKHNISFIGVKRCFSPKKEHFKLKRHQDFFSQMFPSKRSLSPITNSINSTALSSY